MGGKTGSWYNTIIIIDREVSTFRSEIKPVKFKIQSMDGVGRRSVTSISGYAFCNEEILLVQE